MLANFPMPTLPNGDWDFPITPKSTLYLATGSGLALNPSGGVLNVAGGSAATRTPATTNYLTRQKRTAYQTLASAGQVFTAVGATSTLITNNGNPDRGFFGVQVFAISDAAPVATARMFVGWSTSGGPGNIEYNTLVNSVGVIVAASDQTQLRAYSGAASANLLNTGLGSTNFSAAHNSTNVYAVCVHFPPGQTVGYLEVLNRSTGATSGVIEIPSSDKPVNTQFLRNLLLRTNNTTAAAVAVDLIAIYQIDLGVG
jgi:hypothetical protein